MGQALWGGGGKKNSQNVLMYSTTKTAYEGERGVENL